MPSKIEWTDESWNPITGCTPISAGCLNCYAARMAPRLAGMGVRGYSKDEPFRPGTWHKNVVEKPLHWTKPRRIFVCSMGDLFHQDVRGEDQKSVWAIMRACPQHTFYLLTKRPWRAREFINERTLLPNVWVGVTAENQKQANLRIPVLLTIKAAVHFISVEPMLTPVRLLPEWLDLRMNAQPSVLDWVICGGETGSSARPMQFHWVEDLADQCNKVNVPFFLKSWGGNSRRRTVVLSIPDRWRQYPQPQGAQQ